MDNEDLVVNFDALRVVVLKNGGNCLCVRGQKCPCVQFAEEKVCKCGVFNRKI